MPSERDVRSSNRNNQASGPSSSENSQSTVAAPELIETANVPSESTINNMIQMALQAHTLAFTEMLRAEFRGASASAGMNTPVQETRGVVTTDNINISSNQETASSSTNTHRSEVANLRLDYDGVRSPYSTYQTDKTPMNQWLVHPRAYKLLQDVHYKAVASNKINSTSIDIQRRVDAFKAILNSADLLQILDGRRKRPVQTPENPNGYSARQTLVLNDPTSITMEDDIYYYIHDEKKIFSLVMSFFDESLHFHCPDDIKKEDGIAIFTNIMAKIKGKALKDIDKHQTTMDAFRINPDKPLPAELCRLEECMLALEHAQGEKIPDGRKKNMVTVLILKDPRQIFHHTVTQDHKTYQSLKDSICHLYDNLPSSHQTVRMARMREIAPPQVKKQICFKHQRGTCTRGDQCLYSHEPVDKAPVPPKHEKRDTGKKDNLKPPTNKYIDRKPKFDFSNITLTDKIKKIVGPPSAAPAVNNQRGYSSNQKFKIKTLLAFESMDSDTPAWGEPEEFFMNSLRASYNTPEKSTNPIIGLPSDTDNPQSVSVYPPADPVPETPSRISPQSFDMTRSVRQRLHLSDKDRILQALSHMSKCDRDANTRVPFRQPRSQVSRYTLYVSTTPKPHHTDKKTQVPILNIFGWTQMPWLDSLTAESDYGMWSPTHMTMALVYHLGKSMFSATTSSPIPPYSETDQTSTSPFMMYNPTYEPEFNGIKSTYVSGFRSISEYVSEVITISDSTALLPKTICFLMYVIIYDFMSYASTRLGSFGTVEHIRDDRKAMLAELFTANNDDNMASEICDAFRAVIIAIRPMPSSLSHQLCHTENQHTVTYSRELEPAVCQYENQSTPTRSSNAATALSVSPNRRLHRIFTSIAPTTPLGQSHNSSLFVLVHALNKIHTTSDNEIWDSGATVSGTSDKSKVINVRVCNNVTVQGAFGKSCQPTIKGTIGELSLDCLVIPGMKDTLLSVSDACSKGNVFIFDANGCRGYTATSIANNIDDIQSSGIEVARGILRNGLYCNVAVPHTISSLVPTVSVPTVRTEALLYTNARPASTFEHVHNALGHPGDLIMQWHRKNTPGAYYTDEDANLPRGLCNGCVLGGMRQRSTDHLRVHRAPPTYPGQQFALDAFTCTTPSRLGNNYCDIFTDLFTKVRYPVFTKNRTAAELCAKTAILFDLHPEWNRPDTNRSITTWTDEDYKNLDPRFIRLDAESNYTSVEFLHCVAKYLYGLERTATRDKHANGSAERSNGLVAHKTNVAMLSPPIPVPLCFWDIAMEYTCQTLSFTYNSTLKTSPYYRIHGRHVPFKYLQPFWTPCYVHLGQKN